MGRVDRPGSAPELEPGAGPIVGVLAALVEVPVVAAPGHPNGVAASLLDLLAPGPLDLGAQLNVAKTAPAHVPQGGEDVIELAFQRVGDGTGAVVRVRPVEEVEVWEASDRGAQVRLGAPVPDLIEVAPLQADDLHRRDEVEALEAGAEDDHVRGPLD